MLVTNIATALALQGRRVALIDLNFHEPILHVDFQLNRNSIPSTLADYIAHPQTPLASITHQVTDTLRIAADVPGEIYLVANTPDLEQTAQKRAWLDQFPEAVAELSSVLDLDFVFFDNHAGIEPLHMMQMAMCHTLIAVLQPGQQDYQGTGVILEVAEELDLPTSLVVANEVPTSYNLQAIGQQLLQTYPCHEAFALPYDNKMLALGHNGIFSLRYNRHTLTEIYKQIAATLWVD